jgi:hypothetical protein
MFGILSKVRCDFTKISVSYFYTRCDQNPLVEFQFITFLEENLKGDTTTIYSSPNSDKRSSAKRKKGVEDDCFIALVEQSQKMIRLMTDSADDRKTVGRKQNGIKGNVWIFWHKLSWQRPSMTKMS